MCMFCAAIPATAAVGAKLNTKQQASASEPHSGGADIHSRPIKAITAGLIVLLAIGSVWYHTHFSALI